MTTVTTQVILVSANEISDEEAEEVMDDYDADSLEEVAEEMESAVESLLAYRVFAEADNIPLLDVSTDVHEDWTEEDVGDLRAD